MDWGAGRHNEFGFRNTEFRVVVGHPSASSQRMARFIDANYKRAGLEIQI